MSAKTLTKATTNADRYMRAPTGGVSNSRWSYTNARTWADEGKYLVMKPSDDPQKRAKVTPVYSKLPGRVEAILQDTVRNLKKGPKKTQTIYRKSFLPYIPVNWILASFEEALASSDKKLSKSKIREEVEALGKRLNDEKVSVDLGIKWNGETTRHLPVRIGGTFALLSKQIRDYGLDFTFLTDPNNDETTANDYNIEIIREFAFHGSGTLGGHAITANVTTTGEWVKQHPYGKVWEKEKEVVAKENLFYHIQGPNGKEIDLDDFHYFCKMVVGNPAWNKVDFENNFLYSNEANPQRLSPNDAKTAVDGKGESILASLAEHLVGSKSIHNTSTTLANGDEVPTHALYFSVKKRTDNGQPQLQLEKQSWKTADEAEKTAYLLPSFTLAPYETKRVKLEETYEVNSDDRRELYILLVRHKKKDTGKTDVNGNAKYTNVIDTEYDPAVTLAEVKKILEPHIRNPGSFFNKAASGLEMAITKSVELRKKKKPTTIKRHLFGAAQNFDEAESNALPGEDVKDLPPPEEGKGSESDEEL